MTIRVVLIENRPLFRRGILDTLEKHPDIQIEATADGGEDLSQSLGSAQPDVIIFNTEAWRFNPIAAFRELREAYPDAEMVALVGRGRSVLVRTLIDAGVRGCLFETDEETLALDNVVRRVYRGERVDTFATLKQYVDPSKLGLSPRAMEILLLVAQGYQNDVIARQLSISVSTVKSSLTDTYSQLELSESEDRNVRVSAAGKVWELGLL